MFFTASFFSHCQLQGLNQAVRLAALMRWLPPCRARLEGGCSLLWGRLPCGLAARVDHIGLPSERQSWPLKAVRRASRSDSDGARLVTQLDFVLC